MKQFRHVATVAAAGAAVCAVAVAGHATGTRAQVADAAIAPYTTAHAGVVTGSGVTGSAHVVTTASGRTIVSIHVAGLVPGAQYAVHVHDGRCEDYLGHLRFDPTGPAGRMSEVWLDLQANAAGRAGDIVAVPAVELDRTLSLVVHEHPNPDVVAAAENPGSRIACGTLETA